MYRRWAKVGRKKGGVTGAVALLFAAAFANGDLHAESPPLDAASTAHSTVSTTKADRLVIKDEVRPPSADAEILPPAFRVETIQGTVYQPPAPTSVPINSAALDDMPGKSVALAAPSPALGGSGWEATAVAAPTTVSSLPARQNAGAEDVAPGEIMWSNKAGGQQVAALTPASTDGPAAFNTGGRTMEITVPLRDGQFYLGDIGARISPNNEVSVPKERLVQAVTPLLRSDAVDTLKAVPDSAGYLPLLALKEKGFNVQFDPGKVEMQFAPTIEQRARGQLSTGRRDAVRSANIVSPATVAGYVNMRMGADYADRPFLAEEGTASARLAFDGAVRWVDIVLESAATFDAQDGFSRGATRLVYDMPEEALRFSVGDVTPLRSELQGGPD